MSAQNSVVNHIARPYAVALFDLAKGEGSIAAIESDLRGIDALIAQSPDFSRFLRSPVISADEKAKAIEPVLRSADIGGVVGNFVRVVARNGRLFALPAIITAFRALAAEARGEVTAEVTSASPLSEMQRQSLISTLRVKIGKDVTLNQHVDPSLIGGLKVKIGSQMIDSSLKTKLSAMKVAMKEVG